MRRKSFGLHVQTLKHKYLRIYETRQVHVPNRIFLRGTGEREKIPARRGGLAGLDTQDLSVLSFIFSKVHVILRFSSSIEFLFFFSFCLFVGYDHGTTFCSKL